MVTLLLKRGEVRSALSMREQPDPSKTNISLFIGRH